MSLKKNLAYNFLLSLSQILFPLLSIPYVARVLDPAGIGSVSFMDSLAYYFVTLAEFGIVVYGVREVARKKRDHAALSSLVSELVTLHMITSGTVIVLFTLSLFFLYPKIGDVRLVLFSFSFLLVNSFACEWYFWGTERFRFIAVRSLLTRILGLLSIFVLVRQPEDYVVYYAIIAGTAIANTGWNFIRLGGEVGIRLSKNAWKRHVPHTMVIYKISLVYGIVSVLDNVFLRMVSTAAAVAYYAFAVKIVRLSGALITDAFHVFFPQSVSLLADANRAAFQQSVRNAAHLILLVTVPMAAGIFLLAETFTLVYFGADFLPVAGNLRILALYPLIKSFSLFLNKQLLTPYDQDVPVLRGLVAGAAVFVAATLVLSYFFGDTGASLALLLSEVVVLLLNLHYVHTRLDRFPMLESKAVLQAVGGTLLFIPLVYLVHRWVADDLLRIIYSVVVCITAYLLFLLLLARNELVRSGYRSLKNLLQR